MSRLACGAVLALSVVLWCDAVVAENGEWSAKPRLEPVIDPGVRLALRDSADGTINAWVFLTDKGIGTSEEYRTALAATAATYNPRAVERRKLRRTAPGLFDHRDLPLAEGYVEQIEARVTRLRTQSRWLNAVSMQADLAQIEAVATLPFVRLIRPLARAVPVDPRVAGAGLGTPDGPEDFYGRSSEQLTQINIPAVHALGYTGEGIIIGILDTGFVRTHEAFNEPGHPLQMLGEWDFVNNDPNTGIDPGDPPSQHWHGTLILGTIGAYKPNELVGGAYDAAFYLAKTEDVSGEYPAEEDFYVAGLEWLEGNGADMATSSLGYIDWYTQSQLDGRTAVTTIGVNAATANGMACCTAAGNEGHDQDPQTSHLIAPADAFDVLSVGAVNSQGETVGFSSDGPTADGRVKPELLARGRSTSTVDPDDDQGYTTASGTSLSTPLVACCVALVIDAHPDWSIKQIRTALCRTAWDFPDGPGFDPLYIRGYGIVDVLAAVQMDFTGDLDEDGDKDLDDYSIFLDCYSGPGVPPSPGCESADMDEDNDADLADFKIFQIVFTGPYEPV